MMISALAWSVSVAAGLALADNVRLGIAMIVLLAALNSLAFIGQSRRVNRLKNGVRTCL
jgi:hypothetical protein